MTAPSLDGSGLPPRPAFAASLVLLEAAVKLALHAAVNVRTPYGFHRDELLYLGMGRHLQLWGMDFPPAIAVVARVSGTLPGDSLAAIRFLPAVFGSAVLVFAALIARELGGGRVAQGLAAFCVLTSPLFLRSANLLQPVVMDQLIWSAALYAVVRLCRGYGPGGWLLLGLVLGLGLMTKFSVAFIGLAIVAGVLLSPLRSALFTPWPWLGLAAALAVGAPSLVGQIRLGFPVVAQMADLKASQLERIGPADFLLGQLLWGPSVLIAGAGLYGLLASPTLRAFRALGWSCLAAFVILLLAQGKPYYAGPIYPAMFAAGAVLFERTVSGLAAEVLQVGTVAVLLAFAVGTLPLGVPILSPPAMAAYVNALGMKAAVRTNTGEIGALPQDYADMLGWEEQVATVARVYHALPPDQRARAVVVAGNYGEAGALDYYGPRYGLPAVVSPAGSYWFFGPGDRPGEVVITIGVPEDDLRGFFDSVKTAATVGHPWAVEEERNLAVLIGTGPRTTLQQLWPSLAGQN
ncbi:MAG: glycosyltransferase family 39 protein [Gemmatimonadales bacterium]|nr:glycosyltransferase family 39 protein [Gemmatimonadales bacterium]